MHEQKAKLVGMLIGRLAVTFSITYLGINIDGVAKDEAETLEHDHEDEVQY